ncbi:MAG: hypothetical protein ACREQX_02035 [Candidatus Binataceae bacterium]
MANAPKNKVQTLPRQALRADLFEASSGHIFIQEIEPQYGTANSPFLESD